MLVFCWDESEEEIIFLRHLTQYSQEWRVTMPEDIYTKEKYFSLFTNRTVMKNDWGMLYELLKNVCIQNCPLRVKCKTNKFFLKGREWTIRSFKKHLSRKCPEPENPNVYDRTNYVDINYLEDPNYCPITVLLSWSRQN